MTESVVCGYAWTRHFSQDTERIGNDVPEPIQERLFRLVFDHSLWPDIRRRAYDDHWFGSSLVAAKVKLSVRETLPKRYLVAVILRLWGFRGLLAAIQRQEPPTDSLPISRIQISVSAIRNEHQLLAWSGLVKMRMLRCHRLGVTVCLHRHCLGDCLTAVTTQ